MEQHSPLTHKKSTESIDEQVDFVIMSGPSKGWDGAYRLVTLASALTIALPVIMIIGKLLAGIALGTVAGAAIANPFTLSLLTVGLGVFVLTTAAYAIWAPGGKYHKILEMLKNLLYMITIPATAFVMHQYAPIILPQLV